ncbi:putative protein-tyrosine-phosphatase [Lupinus albus]|uniref:Magnesium-dependent phosphatase n=1 Tax=Lupinus albus TaxID=3870 RepID=A0A6A4P0C5_LUPAL|nr:putative protein-tyrosine-phosphatase [Lupinus albus]
MGDIEKVKDEALQIIGMLEVLPKLVVFDLDYTLWPFYWKYFQVGLTKQRIHTRTGISFNSMLFFDDENRNIQSVSKMGVTSILVGNGVNLGAFREGLTRFSQNWNASQKNKQKWVTNDTLN